MIKDFDFKLVDLDDKCITYTDGEGVKHDLTAKKVAIEALQANYPDEPNVSGEEKLKRFNLADRINKEVKLDITEGDITLLKTLVPKCYSTLAWGRFHQFISI